MHLHGMKHGWLALTALLLALSASPARAAVSVDGIGRTPEAAKRVTLDKGRDAALGMLRRELGPDVPDLTTKYLVEKKIIRLEGEPTEEQTGDFRAVCVIELPAYAREEVKGQLAKLQQDARRHRIEDRQWLLARVLSGLVVVLLVTIGYLRLEHLTAGYYTNLLRGSAVAIVVLTAAGLWLTL